MLNSWPHNWKYVIEQEVAILAAIGPRELGWGMLFDGSMDYPCLHFQSFMDYYKTISLAFRHYYLFPFRKSHPPKEMEPKI